MASRAGLLLLGGGHSHLAALEPLRRLMPRAPIALLAPSPELLYSGMMPGWLAGQYRFEACTIPLREHCRRLGVDWIEARAVDIRFRDRCVIDADGRSHPYERLSVNVGADVGVPGDASIGPDEDAGDLPGTPADSASVLGAKPFERFVGAWQTWLAQARSTARPRRLSVVGGGPAGVELAFAMAARTRAEQALHGSRVTLFTADARLLPGQSRVGAWLAARAAGRHQVEVATGHRLLSCEPGGDMVFETPDGRRERSSDLLILATGARPPYWLAAAARRDGVGVGRDGGLAVDARFRVLQAPGVWAAGDCASFVDLQVPRSGVHALRQGPVLAASLASNGASPGYRPQRHALALLNCCDGSAIALRGSLAAAGGWAWRWKDRIDRRFIDAFAGGRHDSGPGG